MNPKLVPGKVKTWVAVRDMVDGWKHSQEFIFERGTNNVSRFNAKLFSRQARLPVSAKVQAAECLFTSPFTDIKK